MKSNQKQPADEARRRRYSLAEAMNLGFTVAVSLLLPILLGLWLGQKAGSRKIGAAIGCVIGLFSALGALWQMANKKK